MKYLNKNKNKLFSGGKITYRGMVYWFNNVTNEVYRHSIDEEILSSISGHKYADVINNEIVKSN